MPSCVSHELILPNGIVLLPVIQFHEPSHLPRGCLSSLNLFRAPCPSEAGMILMGSQLYLIITVLSKRGLEPPWEIPVGVGRSKSILISSGVCLSALHPLTEDSKCFSLSSGTPAGVVSSLLLCSGEGRAHDGLQVCCNAAEACPVLPPYSLADHRNPLSQTWLFHPGITLGTYSVESVQSALQTGST